MAEAKTDGPTRVSPASPFAISADEIEQFNVDQMRAQNMERLAAYGGVDAVASALKVDLTRGLAVEEGDDYAARKAIYGENHYPEPPMSGWWALFFESFKDLTLIVLCIAAVISFVVGFLEDPEKGWIDGVAILVAVLLVAVVTATNDYQKERQFRALNAVKDDIKINVLRDGHTHRISVFHAVVGEVIKLETGDKVPCDGIYISGDDLQSNESSLTGEPDDIKKNTQKDPFLLSGCQITAGQCNMLAIAVGERSRWGRIKAKLATEAENTPLQDKLDDMVKIIGYIGGGFALATLLGMVIIWFATSPENTGYTTASWIIHAFIIAVTIVVVAVPEGLPLAVTISLAFSTKKMLADNNLIRVLAACETMGNATNICSDKTGTLTENRMTVVATWFNGRYLAHEEPLPATGDLGDQLTSNLITGLGVNSTAHLELNTKTNKTVTIGNKTEGALLMFARDLGGSYHDERANATITKQYVFSSARKMMSTIVKTENGYRMYVKGASEIVLGKSSSYLKNGEVEALNDSVVEELNGVILSMARGALRTIGIAHRDFPEGGLPEDYLDNPPEEDLVFNGLTGIMDPLRGDVKDAVAVCQQAGIMVRMVTGDNIETAKAIARQCGILTEGGMAMEGPTFRDLTPAQLDEILPRLQVLARSSPDDKHTLVVRLNGMKLPDGEKEWSEHHPGCSYAQLKDRLLPGYREEWEAARGGSSASGEVVGVTGDGTNDAPALKAADVGLSMGLSGTEVAKEASDIVIMDDRFSSIKQAVMWGRSVYDNIRKFLQFQLTVNVVALIITFLAAVLGFDPPLNPVMMLWVNLIMDTMGALALGTEPPTLELLDRRPYKRNASLVNRPMWRNILVQSAYQLALLLVMLIAGGAEQNDYPSTEATCVDWTGAANHNGGGLFGSFDVVDGKTACAEVKWDADANECVCNQKDYTHFTFIFNAFVWCQLFNEFNARRINDDWNVFAGLHRNWLFNLVIIVSILMQLFIVEVGGDFTKTTSLSIELWGLSMLLGLVALPLGIIMRFIPVKEDPRDFAGYANLKDVSKASTTINVSSGAAGDEGAAGSGGT